MRNYFTTLIQRRVALTPLPRAFLSNGQLGITHTYVFRETKGNGSRIKGPRRDEETKKILNPDLAWTIILHCQKLLDIPTSLARPRKSVDLSPVTLELRVKLFSALMRRFLPR